MRSARIELYIDTGDANKNKKIFDELHKRKKEIEEEFDEGFAFNRR